MLGLDEGALLSPVGVEKRDGHGVSAVNLRMNEPIRKPLARPSMRLLSAARVLTWISLCPVACGFAAGAMSPQATAAPAQKTPPPAIDAPTPPKPGDTLAGSIEGTVTDQTGHGIAGAQVRLTFPDQ